MASLDTYPALTPEVRYWHANVDHTDHATLPAIAGDDGRKLMPLAAAAESLITCWHDDCYEWRDERWQAVWSRATVIRPE
jgi:hypothetical protein